MGQLMGILVFPPEGVESVKDEDKITGRQVHYLLPTEAGTMRVLLFLGYVQLISFLSPWTTAAPIETAPVVSETEIPSLNYTSSPPTNNLVKRSELDLSHCTDPWRAGALSMGYSDAKLLAAAADRNLAVLLSFLDRNPRPTRAQARRWNRRPIET
ncbi:hypothetical protein BDV12DRAFT_198212 [Aspergillus spectabilis]